MKEGREECKRGRKGGRKGGRNARKKERMEECQKYVKFRKGGAVEM